MANQPIIKDTVSAQYFFTEFEIVSLAQELADNVQKRSNLQARKKSVTAELAAEEKMITEAIESISDKVASKSEYRDYVCVVEFDFINKEKRYVREEDGAVLKIRPLSAADWQMRIEVDDRLTSIDPTLPDPDGDYDEEGYSN